MDLNDCSIFDERVDIIINGAYFWIDADKVESIYRIDVKNGEIFGKLVTLWER